MPGCEEVAGPVTGAKLDLTDGRRSALARLVAAWLAQRTDGVDEGPPPGRSTVVLREVEILRPGRPGLLDVIAEVDGRSAHAVFGLRQPGDETHPLRSSDQPVLGVFEDDHGLALVVDALRDAEIAPLVLAAVMGDEGSQGPVATAADGDEGVVLTFGDRCSLSVFPWLTPGPHPGVALLTTLDDAGFNHLAAPLALWRRGGRDLGIVQELLVGSANGWALALTSLRDLYASGGRPEEAGGDFGPEARALGTMTARMHVALDRAAGRRTVDVRHWVDEVEAAVGATVPETLAAAGAEEAFGSLRASGIRSSALHTHGDFHLGRTARTDHGWVVADCMPGGTLPGGHEPVFRSPLADVADMLWSLHHATTVAAADRDPAGRSAVAPMAAAWQIRNRRAFMARYLATPGIGGLVPADREVVGSLVAVFELERAARRLGAIQS